SGAYGSHIYMVSHLRGLGIGYWATTGNEADLQVSELIGMMAAHDDVHAIMAYAESVKDGDGLRQSLEIARENRKPVIFMKVGRSEVGAAAASSHTASLAGEDAVYDAVLKEHGAYRVRSTEEMLDVAYAALPRIYPTGKRLGLVTISGGAGVLMADAASDCGLEVPPMPEDAQAEIREILPFAAPRNPVDVTAQFFNDLSLIPRFTKSMLDRGGYDGVVGFWTSVAGSPVLGEPLLAHLQETMAAYRDRLFLHCVIAPEEMRARYEQAGFPCFEDPTRAITAMAAMMRFGEAFARTPGAPPDPAAALPRPEGPLDERAAKRLLADAGLPMVEDVIVASAEEAQIAAVRFGGSVALKIASADILHKTDVGGVALNMKPEEAAAGFNRVMAACRAAVPSARIDGVLVSPMAPEGVDCIIGVKRDQVFGPVVLFGLGGVYAEVLRDVACRPGPVGVAAAREMIEEITGVELLKGARGAAPVDFDALAATLSRLSAIAAANADWIESVEINPLRALPKGCLALDALIIPREN
nr:acetate--CoA ligase family protein [Paracoccaceae bacterium]